ncbi:MULTISPECIES: hypothetical protein [unclassified Shinella]|uniref:hypothetical protein n=1 Tax=unclassified Shinella TaxID=2643062 RepID=UPI00234EC792|nr:hypothetical protein [Shinella sp. YE25]MDC7254555.1 hypothetical protein [Shinella sp. YE25]
MNDVSHVVDDRQQKNNPDAPNASLVKCFDDNMFLVFSDDRTSFVIGQDAEIGKMTCPGADGRLQKQPGNSLGAHCCVFGAEALRPSAMAPLPKATNDEQYASLSHPSTANFGALPA